MPPAATRAALIRSTETRPYVLLLLFLQLALIVSGQEPLPASMSGATSYGGTGLQATPGKTSGTPLGQVVTGVDMMIQTVLGSLSSLNKNPAGQQAAMVASGVPAPGQLDDSFIQQTSQKVGLQGQVVQV